MSVLRVSEYNRTCTCVVEDDDDEDHTEDAAAADDDAAAAHDDDADASSYIPTPRLLSPGHHTLRPRAAHPNHHTSSHLITPHHCHAVRPCPLYLGIASRRDEVVP